MKPEFNRIIDRTATDSVKWGARESLFKNKDAIPMWVADMDFPAPQPVIDALTKRVQHGIFGYGTLPENYFETVQKWLQKRHDWKPETDALFHVPGVLAGISMVLSVVTNPGDKVLIQPPVYHPFRHLIKNLNREVVNSPLKFTEGHYKMDFEDLECQLQDGVKAVILCSPHNPVGRVWNRDELLRFAELCEKYNTFVVADEIHSDLILPGHCHTPFASLGHETAKRSAILVAPSKTFNLAGFHAAIAVISDKTTREAVKSRLQQYHVGQPDILAKVALYTAYSQGETWLEELLPYIGANAKYVADFVEERIPEIHVIPCQGTYLLWLDCRGMGLNQEDLQQFMAQEAGIALNEGSMFGKEGTGFMRMNVACPRSTVKQAMSQLEAAIIRFRSK